MRAYVGIDPGLTGGIAIIDDHGITAEVMPVVGKEINIQVIVEYLSGLDNPLVVIEKVHSMPKQGSASGFRFGESFGALKGMVRTLLIPHILVTPQLWKKTVLEGLNWKGTKKKASIQYCMGKYPMLNLLETERCRVPHDGMADAVCLAEFGRMTNS